MPTTSPLREKFPHKIWSTSVCKIKNGVAVHKFSMPSGAICLVSRKFQGETETIRNWVEKKMSYCPKINYSQEENYPMKHFWVSSFENFILGISKGEVVMDLGTEWDDSEYFGMRFSREIF